MRQVAVKYPLFNRQIKNRRRNHIVKTISHNRKDTENRNLNVFRGVDHILQL